MALASRTDAPPGAAAAVVSAPADDQVAVGDMGRLSFAPAVAASCPAGDPAAEPTEPTSPAEVGKRGPHVWPLLSAVATARGKRPTMEDRHVVMGNLWAVVSGAPENLPPCAFFAVYDGHAGVRVAAIAESMLHAVLAKLLVSLTPTQLQSDDLVIAAIMSAFEQTEAEVDRRAKPKGEPQWEDGSTACTVLVLGDKLYSANLGDSRAVLCRKGRAVDLTIDHKPGRPDERTRIAKAGGFVRTLGGIDRVNGDLSVSRAFGDAEYKPDIISAVPEVQVFNLQSNDTWFVIGCDGLWDVYDSSDVGSRVNQLLRKARAEAQAADFAATGLLQQTLNNVLCDDNVSIVLVSFGAKASPEGASAGSTADGRGPTKKGAKKGAGRKKNASESKTAKARSRKGSLGPRSDGT